MQNKVCEILQILIGGVWGVLIAGLDASEAHEVKSIVLSAEYVHDLGTIVLFSSGLTMSFWHVDVVGIVDGDGGVGAKGVENGGGGFKQQPRRRVRFQYSGRFQTWAAHGLHWSRRLGVLFTRLLTQTVSRSV